MKVLLIGNSRIARRRVIPALRSLASMQLVAVASRSRRPSDMGTDVALFDDYDRAISTSGADLAYISLANSGHWRWAMTCLEAGLHVVVDKPACLTEAEAIAMVERAASRRRCVAEAVVFPFHPQFDAMLRAFRDAGALPKRALAAFSFPPLAAGDFRHRRELGGGALNDLGPYVAATSRALFGRAPASVCCRVLARGEAGAETAFSVLLGYEGGAAFSGHFGFDTEYVNRLLVFGPHVAVDVKRAFTLPADEQATLAVRRDNSEHTMDVPASDMFADFLRAVSGAIDSGDVDPFAAALVADARLLAALRRHAGED